MFKGPKGPDDNEIFPRSTYVLFNQGPSPDKAKGKYGETLLQIACDTIEIDTEHHHLPLIKGKITEFLRPAVLFRWCLIALILAQKT